MQFINYSNLDSPEMGKVSKKQLVSALLEHETKNKSRVNKLVEGLEEEVEFSTAVSLFSNKLQAVSALSTELPVEEAVVENKMSWDSLLEKINSIEVDKGVNEARSIGKIQKEWNKVTAILKDTVELWKSTEGKEKEDLLTQLKTLTISKRKLEAELDVAIGLKDADAELVGEATMQEIDKKVQKFVIKNANDYEYSNQDSAFQIYLSLKKLYPTLIKESEATVGVPSKEDLKAYINKNKEEIDNLVDNDAWDKAYMMVLNDFNIEQETPEGESMIALFNELY